MPLKNTYIMIYYVHGLKLLKYIQTQRRYFRWGEGKNNLINGREATEYP
jgi:hypothetical protein